MVIELVINGINGFICCMKVCVFLFCGVYLIVMFVCILVVKEFCCWVLDILDWEVDFLGVDCLLIKFYQRVMFYFDIKGGVINMYLLNKDQVVMLFDVFVSYFRKKGWIVVLRDEVVKGIMGVI